MFGENVELFVWIMGYGGRDGTIQGFGGVGVGDKRVETLHMGQVRV